MIIFMHGEKGGVGKSMALAWLIENQIQKGIKPDIVESDKMRDVFHKYKNVVNVEVAPIQADGDNIQGLINVIEAASKMDTGDNLVFINLPGAASHHIDPHGEIIAEALAAENKKSLVLFLSDGRENSKALYETSRKKGVCAHLEHRVIMNTRGGEKLWKIEGEILMPELPSAVKTSLKVDSVAASMYEVINDSDLGISSITKVIAKKWIAAADPVVSELQEMAG